MLRLDDPALITLIERLKILFILDSHTSPRARIVCERLAAQVGLTHLVADEDVVSSKFLRHSLRLP